VCRPSSRGWPAARPGRAWRRSGGRDRCRRASGSWLGAGEGSPGRRRLRKGREQSRVGMFEADGDGQGPRRAAEPRKARTLSKCSMLATTTSASSGVPSWKVTPRAGEVQTRLSRWPTWWPGPARRACREPVVHQWLANRRHDGSGHQIGGLVGSSDTGSASPPTTRVSAGEASRARRAMASTGAAMPAIGTADRWGHRGRLAPRYRPAQCGSPSWPLGPRGGRAGWRG